MESRSKGGLISVVLAAVLLIPGVLCGTQSAEAQAGAQGAAFRGSPAEAAAQLRTALAQTLEHQDLEGSMGLYEPDAVFLSTEGRFPDRAAIRTLYHSVFLKFRGQITMTSKRLVASGVVCVDDGVYSETITELATGKRTAVTGDYVLVSRRQGDGSWKIAEIVWTQTSANPA